MAIRDVVQRILGTLHDRTIPRLAEVLPDVVGNMAAVQRLRACAEDTNMPHIILAGPRGRGGG